MSVDMRTSVLHRQRDHRRMNFNAMVLLGALLLPLEACSDDAPDCRIAAGKTHAAEGSAGCLIERRRKMLIVRHLMSGKLGMPAGFGESGESAQCTAHRETWEEAGVAVQVGELLWEDPANDFYLFACYLEGDRDQSGPDGVEIEAVMWLDPHGLESSQWRFPDQWVHVLEAFQRLSSSDAP